MGGKFKSSRARTRHRLSAKTCPCCQLVFHPTRSRVTFCSKRCKSLCQWDVKPAAQSTNPRPNGTCLNCGQNKTLCARGICTACHRDPEIRSRFPSRQRGPKPSSPLCRECLHCHRTRRTKSRGLCTTCHSFWDIRSKYPVMRKNKSTSRAGILTEAERWAAIESNRWAIEVVARRMFSGGFIDCLGGFEEAVSAAKLGVFASLARWDDQLAEKMKISTFIYKHARWSILSANAKEANRRRKEGGWSELII